MEFRVVPADELIRILKTLDEFAWPVPFEQAAEVFERLGWEKQRRKGGSTGFDISKPFVSIGEMRGELSRIEFRVSDTLEEASAESRATALAALDVAARAITEGVGFAPTGTPWTMPGHVWDLPDGRQVQLKAIDRLLEVQYFSKRYADIERRERRQGVDPARNPDG